MKNILIFSNINKTYLLRDLLTNYNLTFQKLSNYQNNNEDKKIKIIFHDKNLDHDFNFNKVLKNTIIISNDINIKEVKKGIFLNAPTTINNFKKIINEIIYESKTIIFSNIEIVNDKIINNLNQKSCNVTHIEKEILTELIDKKNCKKSYIKENILLLKQNIETNSLESHLSRIRKKLEIINSRIKLISKKDRISIVNSQSLGGLI
tara:strand:+ start:98 stop:715 length:618 start_codon:yes stop_codon:yes gene_type:complete